MAFLSLLASSAAACGGGSGLAQDPTPTRVDEQTRSSDAPRSPTPSSTAALASPPPAAVGPAARPSAPSSAPPGKPADAPAPKTAGECKALTAKVTPPPSNQADTQLQMRTFFDAYRDTFRCCFDALWSSQHPGASGTVTLLVTIDGTGSFTAAEIDAPGTTVQSTEVQACIVDIAKSLTYPKPASGKDIRYTRLLNFSPR